MNRGSIHDSVVLVPWSESWAEAFRAEKERITEALRYSGHEATIYHVGSTSIEGMVSKPIIDILVCPDKNTPVEALLQPLMRIGYSNLGEGGRPGRYFLSYGDTPNESFYVHLCHEDNQVAQDQMLFQKLERENSVIRKMYLQTKLLLADEFPNDREMYRVVKGLYIEGVLSAYRQANTDAE